ncbi:YfiR family protein [Endozoicomonas euniceicola]|uniref:YfiR family protein n=1 Tax=Endozoicomonas euniceicola TaxID=1234143 RepID=A0ABY6GYI5_9GAMM|nr:YfiR family protein [Endozoicomonas euniceicola]UYM17845.1 YfiR family protein [Endozoicomonas euniceicola]
MSIFTNASAKATIKVTTKVTIISLVSAILFSFQLNTARAATSPEDKIKTAIIFKLTKFISWPKKTQSLTICVLGEGSINNELHKINRKNTMGRRLSVTHRNANSPFEKLCDALFIHNIDNVTVKSVLKRLEGKPVLTISDIRSFVDYGGMIGLKRSGKKINFSINNTSATNANLNINSKLLKLAKTVK